MAVSRAWFAVLRGAVRTGVGCAAAAEGESSVAWAAGELQRNGAKDSSGPKFVLNLSATGLIGFS